jgi:arylsulfatase A-like enzyme
MTGKYNFRNYTEFGSLRPGETTFAHMLQEAGYATCVAGKWQLAGHYEGSNYQGEGTLPDEAGFDEHCLWQVDRLGSRYWDPVIQRNGALQEGLEDRFGPDVVCDFIVDFIQRHREERFLVYYPMILTHSPFVPTPMDSPGEQERDFGDRTNFISMVAYADFLVSRIVKALDDLGLRDDTMIVFTCDNGSPRGISSQRLHHRCGHTRPPDRQLAGTGPPGRRV